jgi:hypothetical protein
MILTPTDFRLESLHEACVGYDLTDDVAESSQLEDAIARLTERLDDYTNDHFEPETLTLDLVSDGTTRLVLPRRFTAITSVKFYDDAGTLGIAQAAASYRLHSSLIAGSKRLSKDALDWISTVPYSVGFTGGPTGSSAYRWPTDVQVVGTAGWTTCPGDIKVALAQMVWDHFTAQAGQLGRASQLAANGETFQFLSFDPEAGSFTGLRDADAIIRNYRRSTPVLVA